jgi:hypothetical protein
MVGRILFPPAVLLYPFVGQGFCLGLEALQKIRFSRAMKIAAIVVFLSLPCAKSFTDVIETDRSAIAVGNAVKQDANLRDAHILFSESRHLLYADKLDNFFVTKAIAKQLYQYLKKKRFSDIEAFAEGHEADAIVLYLNKDKVDHVPSFKSYAEYKRIPGPKGVTVIYRAE